MGDLEKSSLKGRRRNHIQKVLLNSIYVVGGLSLALLAPNALQLLKQIDPSYKYRKKNPRYTVNTTISRLLEKDLIYFKNTQKGKFVRLTPKGEAKLREIDLSSVYEKQKRSGKKWDGRWRIIIFDIKENRRGVRDKIRRSLVEIGFYKLQNSVWVYPYDFEDLLILLKADFKIGKDVLYIIADRIENDKVLRSYFNLHDHLN